MTATLRPLVGPGVLELRTEKKFFVAHWIDCMEPARPTNPVRH
jgi:hypothetical protein